MIDIRLFVQNPKRRITTTNWHFMLQKNDQNWIYLIYSMNNILFFDKYIIISASWFWKYSFEWFFFHNDTITYKLSLKSRKKLNLNKTTYNNSFYTSFPFLIEILYVLLRKYPNVSIQILTYLHSSLAGRMSVRIRSFELTFFFT